MNGKVRVVQGPTKAGLAYFAIVFSLGFALGTVRTLVLVPRLGETASVLIELPIVLSAAWVICRRLVDRFAVSATSPSRLAMGTIAFALLLSAEATLSIAVFGDSPSEYVSSYASAAGCIGFAGQVVYATFPLVQLRCS